MIAVSLMAAPAAAEPPPVARAGMPAGEKPFVAAAAAAIVRLGEPGGVDLPKASDPTIRRVLDEAATLTRTLGTPAAPVDSLEDMDTLCRSATRIILTYSFAGLKGQVNDKTPVDQAVAIISKAQAQNTAKYFDVIFPLRQYDQHCTAVFIPAMDGFIANLPADKMTPVRKDALKGLGHSAQEMLREAMALALNPGITAKGRGVIVSQLEADFDNLVLAVPAADRPTVTTWLGHVGETAPADIGSRVKALSARVATVRCGALCKA